MNVAVGQTVGRYELLGLAGRGSMAEVYEARNVDTGETVAVKMLHPHLFNQPSQLERFRREAEVLKKVQHPGIARFYDFVVAKGVAYMVMEFLGGGTLEKRLAEGAARREQVSLEQANEWMSAICSAVDYAHRHGLVHRDLKPANIMFRNAHELVLTDFGLVYWIDQPRLSGTGAVTGTPTYISPEQARGQPGDRRSDVYSLGVVLYEMLAGQPPFQGNTLGVAVKHISELPPSPRVLGRYLPPGVEAVVMRALSKDPIERYQSAQLLADAFGLAIARVNAPPAAAPVGRPAQVVSPLGANNVAVSPPRRPLSDLAVLDTERAREADQRQARARGQAWRTGLATVLGLLAFAVGTWWLVTEFMTPAKTGASTPPRFAIGQQIRITTDDPQASVSSLRGCPTGFWMGVLGMASKDDEGKVLERQTCGGEWWYRVSIPAAADAEWDGVGWVKGIYLEPR